MHSQCASRGLDDINPALLRVRKHHAVDGWHIDTFRQTPRVRHENAIVIDKLPQ
jgi:hypothetical protein